MSGRVLSKILGLRAEDAFTIKKASDGTTLFNQGVATTSSPSFAGVTLTEDSTVVEGKVITYGTYDDSDGHVQIGHDLIEIAARKTAGSIYYYGFDVDKATGELELYTNSEIFNWDTSGTFWCVNVAGIAENIDYMIEAPTNKRYVVRVYAAHAFTVNSLSYITVSGTCTIKAERYTGGAWGDITSLTSLSASSTIATTSATGNNTFAVGERLAITVSSASAPVDLAISFKITRA
jgi:hypothetical protein